MQVRTVTYVGMHKEGETTGKIPHEQYRKSMDALVEAGRAHTEYVERNQQRLKMLEVVVGAPEFGHHIYRELLNRFGSVSGRDIHEVGCGTGELAFALQKLGANLSASEPDRSYALVARGAGVTDLHQEDGAKALRRIGNVDAVVSMDVLGSSTTHAKAVELLEAARAKTDFQVHVTTLVELGGCERFLHPDWKTTFHDIQRDIIIVMERIEPRAGVK